jgi:hypothetical protein
MLQALHETADQGVENIISCLKRLGLSQQNA